MATKTVQDLFGDTTKISTQTGTEVTGGVLQNEDMGDTSNYYWDGVNDTATAANEGNFDFERTSAFSAVMWVRNTDTTVKMLLNKTETSGTFRGWDFLINYDGSASVVGKLTFRLISDAVTGPNILYVATTEVTRCADIGWHQVAFTYSGNSLASGCRIYVDGVSQSLTTVASSLSATILNNVALNVGSRGGAALFWRGWGENVSIYNVALTEANIQDLFLETTVPTDYGASCVSWWKLNGDGADSVGANTLTLTGVTSSTTTGQYSTRGTTVSTSKLGAGSMKSATNFYYTSTQKPGGTRNVLQFSNDNSTWVNAAGKSITNTSGLSFDGLDDYVSIADAANLSFGNGTTDSAFSISAWIYVDALTNTFPIFSKDDALTSLNREYVLYVNTDGTLTMYLIDQSAGPAYLGKSTIAPIKTKVWTHIAVTYSGVGGANAEEGILIYVNGASWPVQDVSKSGTYVAMESLASVAKIGWRSAIAAQFAKGLIDNVAVYSVALTQANINSLMQRITIPSDHSGISWWKFDENTGTTAADSIGSNTGTLTGGPTWVSDWWRLHHAGNAIEDANALFFDGTGDYVTIANEGNFDFERTSAFSVQAWVKTKNNVATIICGKFDNSAVRGYQLIMTSTGEFQVNIVSTITTNECRRTSIERINDDQWHQVYMTYDGSSALAGLLLYIDGILVNTSASNDNLSSTILNNVAFQISGRNGSNFIWDGCISNVAVWNDVRTAGEVFTDYQNGYIDVSNANLVSSWAINEGTGTTITDSEAANAGTISGNPQWIKDEYRPIPASPSQQTISLSTIGGAWTDFYYRSFSEIQTGMHPSKLTEVTLEYTATSGGLLLRKVGS